MLPDEIPIHFTIRPRELLVSPYWVGAVICMFLLPWGAASAPAWVQAIGSVAAVGVAIYIAGNQERRQERAEKQKERVVIKAVAEIARRGSMGIDEIHMLASEGEVVKQKDRFVSAIDSVEREWQRAQAIRLVDLPDESTLDDFTLLEHNLRSCVASSRRYLAGAEGEELRSIATKVTFNKDIVKNIAKRLSGKSI